MAETAAEREQRISTELGDRYREEGDKINKAAIKARDDEPADEGFADMAAYREHVGKVPGIFGDLDTTAGPDAAGIDVVSANNEAATVAEAEVDASDSDEAEGVTRGEARRQVDAGNTTPSAQEVEKGAEKRDAKDDKKPVVAPKK